jgi:type IV pilus assembly protein PilN
VHLLDQMVRQLPDGVYLRSLKQNGTKVTVVGYAQSNARVSTLMRNIDSSPWLTQPELVEIKAVPAPGAKDRDARVNEFTLSFRIKRETPPQDAKAAGKPGASPAKAAPAKGAPAKGAPGAKKGDA